jgi:hypothetical protein
VRDISGRAVVDQHGLNVYNITNELPPNPDKFSPDEFHIFSQRQLEAAGEHADIKSVAKAFSRESDMATSLKNMSGQSGKQAYADLLTEAGLPAKPPELNETLSEISRQLKEKPSKTVAILRQNKLTPTDYRNQALAELKRYHLGIGGKV